jgi:hypothetical protein
LRAFGVLQSASLGCKKRRSLNGPFLLRPDTRRFVCLRF